MNNLFLWFLLAEFIAAVCLICVNELSNSIEPGTGKTTFTVVKVSVIIVLLMIGISSAFIGIAWIAAFTEFVYEAVLNGRG